MTIEDQNYRISYTANGAGKVFAFNFRILSESDLTVIVQDTSGVDTTKALTTDYTVTGAGNAGGGVVTFGVAPTNLHTVSIILDPDVKQLLDLTHASTIPSQSLEDAFDVAINNVKRARDLIDRSLVLQDGDVSGEGAFDASSNRLTSLGTPTAATDAATKSYVDSTVAAAAIDSSGVVTDQAAELLNDTSYDAMLATLGAGSKGIAILKDTTNGAVLTELGVSGLAQNILVDSNTAEVHATLEIPQLISQPNELVNGDFQVWQHGTSFTGSAPASGGNDDNVYTADQWVLLSNGNDEVDVAQGTDSLPVGARGRVNMTTTGAEGSGAGRFGLLQILDNRKTTALRQQKVGLSLEAKRTGSLTGMKAWILSWAGTADAPTRDVINAWNSGTTDPTFQTNWTAVGSVEFTATASWAQYGFSAEVEVPVGANNLAVFIATDDASWGSGDQVTFTNVHLYREHNSNTNYDGLLPRFDSRPFHEELRECQRFFLKTFPHATYPAQNTEISVGALKTIRTRRTSTYHLDAEWRFPVEMAKTPTLTTYDWHAAATTWSNSSGAAPFAIAGAATDTISAFISSVDVSTTDELYFIHATADARF